MSVRLRVLVAVSALTGLMAVAGAAAALPGHVSLTVSITGKGSVRLSDGRRLGCGTSRCHRTFAVRAGTTVKLTARPGSGWVLSKWGGVCTGTKPTCALRPRRATAVAVTFAAPGSTSVNSIPLGHAVTFSDGWVFKVVSATLDATAQIVAIAGNTPPAPGAQYAMLNLAATYMGGGSSALDRFGDRFETIGAHNFSYRPCYQDLPPPVLPLYTTVFSGQSISGNICFEIASNDAASLHLRTYDDGGSGYVWFALR